MTASTSSKILIIEDDETIRIGLRDYLITQGYEVSVAADGHQGRVALVGDAPDLVLLDVMLPGPGGLELLTEFRESHPLTPVLLLTARGDENDKVLGLELGADDYVTKPFSLREVGARIKAQLRRVQAAQPSESSPQVREPVRIGDVTVDFAGYQVCRSGKTLPLSPKEAALLELLVREAGQVVPRVRILDELWAGRYVSDRTIDTHVLNLRKKIEVDAKHPKHLNTVHGVGYRLVL